MNEIEKKIYISWAFSENEREKGKINQQIYKEDLQPKSKAFWGMNAPTEEETKTLTCYKLEKTGYGHKEYKILSNPHKLTTDQLALICDSGNLCFGYRKAGNNIVIHTD